MASSVANAIQDSGSVTQSNPAAEIIVLVL